MSHAVFIHPDGHQRRIDQEELNSYLDDARINAPWTNGAQSQFPVRSRYGKLLGYIAVNRPSQQHDALALAAEAERYRQANEAELARIRNITDT